MHILFTQLLSSIDEVCTAFWLGTHSTDFLIQYDDACVKHIAQGLGFYVFTDSPDFFIQVVAPTVCRACLVDKRKPAARGEHTLCTKVAREK